MTQQPYTPEQRAADALIAKAMGWTEVEFRYWDQGAGIGDFTGFPPGSAFDKDLAKTMEALSGEPYHPRPSAIPRFHESHDARAALLEWIDGMCKWYAFMEAFAANEEIEWNPGFWNTINKAIALATPAQVAEAALKVIQENNK